MKKQTCKYFLMIVIYTCMTTNFSFSQEEQPQETQKRSSNSRQWTNSELCELGVDLKSRQVAHDVMLGILLFNYHGSPELSNDDIEKNLSHLQKLEWVIKTNKASYKWGEPVGIRVFLRNVSQEEVPVFGAALVPGFFLNSIQIKKNIGVVNKLNYF